ncbi:L,D-transpeptidase family protein [Modestobacter sp. URMC 112]
MRITGELSARLAARVLLVLLAAVVLVAGVPGLAAPARAAAGGDLLVAGEGLAPGQQLVSADRRYRAVMQPDGNFVVYAADGRVLAATGTYGAGNRLTMQADGNLVVYSGSGRPLWDTRSWGNAGARVVLQTNGDLVVWRSNGTPAWSTGWDTPDRLRPGQSLYAGQQLTSPDRRYRTVVQPDGNVVVYAADGRVLAATGTYVPNSRLTMQADGNLVLYAPWGSALWSTRTWGSYGAQVVLQDNGDLVVWRTNGTPAWSTGWDTPDRLRPGQSLYAGQQLTAPDGRHRFAVQPDGNVVLYGPAGRVLSATGTYGAGHRLTLQTDGNLVVYSGSGRPVWDTRTWGNAGAQVVLRADGNLVLSRTDGSTAWASPFPLPVATGPSTQVVTVVADHPGATTGRLVAWERRGTGWTPVLGPVPAQLGASGVGAASEGSTRTPAGTFTLSESFGRAGNPGTALPYRQVDGSDWWVSDVRSPLYNQYARCAPGSCPFDESAGENLWAQGAVYDHAVVIDYNRRGTTPGAGSAFFLHVSNGRPTAGCVAVDRGSLVTLMRWLDPARQPLIAIG